MGGGGGGARLHWREPAIRPGSVAGVKVLWNLEYPVGLIKKRKYMRYQWRKLSAIWTVRQKGKKKATYYFGFSRPKVAQIGPNWYWSVSLGCLSEPWKGPDLLVVAWQTITRSVSFIQVVPLIAVIFMFSLFLCSFLITITLAYLNAFPCLYPVKVKTRCSANTNH